MSYVFMNKTPRIADHKTSSVMAITYIRIYRFSGLKALSLVSPRLGFAIHFDMNESIGTHILQKLC